MANLIFKIGMFLSFGTTLFFFVLAQIFSRHEKWKNFFEKVALLSFGIGLMILMLCVLLFLIFDI